MFLCYVDESGYNGNKFNAKQPVQVMVGVLVNVYNYHKAHNEFQDVFNIIQKEIPIKEIKAEEIYRGRNSWRDIKSESRDAVIEYYLDWISDSPSIKFIITAIDNEKYFQIKKGNPNLEYFNSLPCPYTLAGLHVAITIQKINKNINKNKGKTILIYDEQNEHEDHLSEIIFKPPNFIDEFVEFDPGNGSRLDVIIDSAYFVKSHHSSMAQIADIASYFLRLYFELNFCGFSENYTGEKKKVTAWIDTILKKAVSLKKIYQKNPKTGFLKFIKSVQAIGIENLP